MSWFSVFSEGATISSVSNLQEWNCNVISTEGALLIGRQVGGVFDQLDHLQGLLELWLQKLGVTMRAVLSQLDEHRVVLDNLISSVHLVNQCSWLHVHHLANMLVD